MATETETTEEKAERKPTERVVLARCVAMRIPVDATEEQVQAAVDALYPKAKKAARADAVSEMWREVARVTAPNKASAIEAYAGKPGTADAKQGTFRAPTLTSWKDARVFEAPPAPLVEARTVE